jgi:cytochrome c oxidase subunit 4
VFVVLMLLLALTVAAARVDFGRLNPVIAMGIAVVKAALIAIYFMHLRHALGLTRVFAFGATVWLIFGAALTFADYFTRGWEVSPLLPDTAPVASDRTLALPGESEPGSPAPAEK